MIKRNGNGRSLATGWNFKSGNGKINVHAMQKNDVADSASCRNGIVVSTSQSALKWRLNAGMAYFTCGSWCSVMLLQ